MSADAGNKLPFACKRIDFVIVEAVYAIMNALAAPVKGANDVELVCEATRRAGFSFVAEAAFADALANVEGLAVWSMKDVDISPLAIAKHIANRRHVAQQFVERLPRSPTHTRNTFITSSPKWLITFTAIRPFLGRSKGRETSR